MKSAESSVISAEGEGVRSCGKSDICDDDPVVEQAFADAEPPAHDDWIPDKMPKSWAKTFVRVALARLKYLAASYAYPASSSTSGASEQPPLAKAADLLGNCMPAIGGTGGGSGGSRGRGNARGGGGRGGGRNWRVAWRAGSDYGDHAARTTNSCSPPPPRTSGNWRRSFPDRRNRETPDKRGA